MLFSTWSVRNWPRKFKWSLQREFQLKHTKKPAKLRQKNTKLINFGRGTAATKNRERVSTSGWSSRFTYRQGVKNRKKHCFSFLVVFESFIPFFNFSFGCWIQTVHFYCTNFLTHFIGQAHPASSKASIQQTKLKNFQNMSVFPCFI